MAKRKSKAARKPAAAKRQAVQVFYDGPAPTPFRSARLGVEVTLSPGVNVISDPDLASEMVRQGVVSVVPAVHPNVTDKSSIGSKTHEPVFAEEGQGLRGDLEAAKRSGVSDRGSVVAADRALAADIDRKADEARKREAVEGIKNKDGVFYPEIRPTALAGTEAGIRHDLTDDQRRALLRSATGAPTPRGEVERIRRKIQTDAPVRAFNKRKAAEEERARKTAAKAAAGK